MNKDVDFFFERESQWKQEYLKLRTIVLRSGLAEVLKWGVPCYTLEDKNVVLIHGFKEYCALLFHKGALMKDTAGILIRQTENVQAARQIRFRDVKDITELESTLESYLTDAMAVERSGQKIQKKATAAFPVPDEFREKLETIPGLRTAFEALTPGRQRAYLFFFSRAKLSETRKGRVERFLPHILSGKGMDDD